MVNINNWFLEILLGMDLFLINLSCVLLTVVYIIVLSCVSATDAVVDTMSRRQIRHVIDVATLTDVPSGNHTLVRW